MIHWFDDSMTLPAEPLGRFSAHLCLVLHAWPLDCNHPKLTACILLDIKTHGEYSSSCSFCHWLSAQAEHRSSSVLLLADSFWRLYLKLRSLNNCTDIYNPKIFLGEPMIKSGVLDKYEQQYVYARVIFSLWHSLLPVLKYYVDWLVHYLKIEPGRTFSTSWDFYYFSSLLTEIFGNFLRKTIEWK